MDCERSRLEPRRLEWRGIKTRQGYIQISALNFGRKIRRRYVRSGRKHRRRNRGNQAERNSRMVRSHLALHRMSGSAVMAGHFLLLRTAALVLRLRSVMAVRQAAHPVAARAVKPALRQQDERHDEQRQDQCDGLNASHVRKSNTISWRALFQNVGSTHFSKRAKRLRSKSLRDTLAFLCCLSHLFTTTATT
jgi:hypothetical protein